MNVSLSLTELMIGCDSLRTPTHFHHADPPRSAPCACVCKEDVPGVLKDDFPGVHNANITGVRRGDMTGVANNINITINT